MFFKETGSDPGTRNLTQALPQYKKPVLIQITHLLIATAVVLRCCEY